MKEKEDMDLRKRKAIKANAEVNTTTQKAFVKKVDCYKKAEVRKGKTFYLVEP
jgi:hypothetical protein